MQHLCPSRGVLVLCAAALTAPAAMAQEGPGGVRLVFGIEQRVEYGRNLGLTVPAEGATTASATTLSFGLSSETALDRLEFAASAALRIENGPDTSGTESDFTRPTLAFSYTREVPNALFGVELRYVSDDIDRLSDDLGDADAIGTQTNSGVTLRFETGRLRTASFFVEAAYDQVDYQDTVDPDYVDTLTTALALGSRLRFSEVLTGTLRLGFTREEEDGAVDTTDTRTASFSLDRALANGSASLGLTRSDEVGVEARTTLEIGRSLDLPRGALAVRLGVSRSDLGGTDVIGGVDWTYTLADGAISLSLVRASSYDADDAETTIDTTLSVGWTQNINAVSSFGLDASWALSDAPSERIEEAEFGASYTRLLTPDWELGGGIRYRVREDAGGRAESPLVFVSLGRSFAIRP